MWRFVSAARMAQIKADARAEGYIKAVREGLAANDAAKDLRRVTSDNTHAANTAVQEMKAQAKQSRRHLASYQDKNLRLIEDGAALEAYIFNCIGKMSNYAIARLICKKMGTHVRGKNHPMKVDQPFVGRVINRQMNWDARLGYFIRQRKD